VVHLVVLAVHPSRENPGYAYEFSQPPEKIVRAPMMMTELLILFTDE